MEIPSYSRFRNKQQVGDAEGCGKDVQDGVENEYSEGMVYWIVCILAKQYIEKTKEGSLIFLEYKRQK